MTEPAAAAVRDARRHFRRCRRRILGATSVTVAALAALGVLLLAPNRLASLRLGEVAVAWWVMGAVALVGLVALSRGFRESGPAAATPAGTSWLAPLALAVVWGSPAFWLGLPPLLLGDGLRGLWPPAVVIVGAIVAMLLRETPWGRVGGFMATTSGVVRARWPGARGCQVLLGSTEILVLFLFVWAQFAAAREIGAMVGWPRASTIGIIVLVLAAALLPDLARVRLAALGGGLALMSLAVPLVLIALGTTAAWPWVWSAVASRPRIAFSEGTSWTLEGEAVRGTARTATLRFVDEQRVWFAGRGTVIIELRAGDRFALHVEAGEEVALHPGDRLVVPEGLRLRFEPGRRVPDAPDSGPEWVEPPSRDSGWLGLLALALTGLLGALGLPAGALSAGAGRLPPRRGAQLTAGLVTSGVALAVGWSLYAAWLTPEVYAGGVAGTEVYALPASVPGLGAWGRLLAWLALGGLAAGGAASALAGLRGLPGLRGPASAPGRARHLALLLVPGAGLLACLVPAGAWVLLVLALGLAASTLAPAAVLAGWGERATAQGAAAGVTVGLVAFLLVVLAGAVGPAGAADGWQSTVAAAPAMVAVPAHLLVAGLLRSRRTPGPRLPPGLEGLSAPLPARSRPD